LRPESAIIIVLSLVMAGLCLANRFWLPAMWWAWLLFGLAGLSAIVWLSVRDSRFFHPILLKIFTQRVDRNVLRMPELKDNVDTALSSHRALFDEIARHPNAPLSWCWASTAPRSRSTALWPMITSACISPA
jgi:hypothetical protein